MSLPDFNNSDRWSTPKIPTYEFGFDVIVKSTVSPGPTSSRPTLISTYATLLM